MAGNLRDTVRRRRAQSTGVARRVAFHSSRVDGASPPLVSVENGFFIFFFFSLHKPLVASKRNGERRVVAVSSRVARRAVVAVVVVSLSDGRGRRGSPQSRPAQEDRVRFRRGAHERHELSRGRAFAPAVGRDRSDRQNADRGLQVRLARDKK